MNRRPLGIVGNCMNPRRDFLTSRCSHSPACLNRQVPYGSLCVSCSNDKDYCGGCGTRVRQSTSEAPTTDQKSQSEPGSKDTSKNDCHSDPEPKRKSKSGPTGKSKKSSAKEKSKRKSKAEPPDTIEIGGVTYKRQD